MRRRINMEAPCLLKQTKPDRQDRQTDRQTDFRRMLRGLVRTRPLVALHAVPALLRACSGATGTALAGDRPSVPDVAPAAVPGFGSIGHDYSRAAEDKTELSDGVLAEINELIRKRLEANTSRRWAPRAASRLPPRAWPGASACPAVLLALGPPRLPPRSLRVASAAPCAGFAYACVHLCRFDEAAALDAELQGRLEVAVWHKAKVWRADHGGLKLPPFAVAGGAEAELGAAEAVSMVRRWAAAADAKEPETARNLRAELGREGVTLFPWTFDPSTADRVPDAAEMREITAKVELLLASRDACMLRSSFHAAR